MYLELSNNIATRIEEKEKLVLQLQNKYSYIINSLNNENKQIQYYDVQSLELENTIHELNIHNDTLKEQIINKNNQIDKLKASLQSQNDE